jgi:hypothetical protein
MFRHRFLAFSIVLLLGMWLTPDLSAQRGALTVQRNLAELTSRADVILRGQVVSAKFERHPDLRHLNTVLVSMRVKEVLKGSSPATYTFRQYVWDVRDRFNTAGYRKGEQLLLMMNRPSQFGLTSPVGLEQGRFRIVRNPSGALMAANGRGNAGLFANVLAQVQRKRIALSPAASKMLQTRSGAVPADDLSELIRALVGKK